LDQDVSRTKGKFSGHRSKKSKSKYRITFISLSTMEKDWL